MLESSVIDSPIGKLLAVFSAESIVMLLFRGNAGKRDLAYLAKYFPGQELSAGNGGTLERKLRTQLEEYFSGNRERFDLPLDLQGTPFQHRVWNRLQAIPYGNTVSYGEIAGDLDSSARAVGNANGKNPIPIVVPCHRVIGADGSLTGFGGGLDLKRYLLQLEGIELLDSQEISQPNLFSV